MLSNPKMDRLLKSIEDCDIKTAQEIINQETDQGTTRWLALIIAIVYKLDSKIGLLIECDINLNRQSETGQTVLMLAVEHGRETVIESLLSKGADPNLRTVDGWTALMTAMPAVSSGDCNQNIVELLLRYHADPDIENTHGTTASILAKRWDLPDIIELLDNHSRYRAFISVERHLPRDIHGLIRPYVVGS